LFLFLKVAEVETPFMLLRLVLRPALTEICLEEANPDSKRDVLRAAIFNTEKLRYKNDGQLLSILCILERR